MTLCASTASCQVKPKSPSFVIRVVSVEGSPGWWPGLLESYAYFTGVVVKSSAVRFPVGAKLHIGVFPNPDSPFFEHDRPQFRETMVSVGRLIRVKATKKCINTLDADEFRTDSSCLQLLQK